jgi:glucose/arabinose dehydrogenase
MTTSSRLPGAVLSLGLAALAACGPTENPSVSTLNGATGLAANCTPGNGGITLPDGFCAIVVAEDVTGARHITVADNGDVFVALEDTPTRTGGVAVLRDTDGDGRADEREEWGDAGGNEVLLADGWVYHAPDDRVLRYPLQAGQMTPSGPPETIVSGRPDTLSHSLALGDDGSLYVNIGSPSNVCQQSRYSPGSPGIDPCPELETRAGIWRFDADRTGQTAADGTRFATGMRNTVALRMHPTTGVLYGAVHGRDQLHTLWPDLFTVNENAEKPGEEFVRIEEGADYGWPYCYYDPQTNEKVLAPEYGGDGQEVGRCADKDLPIVAFPGHWAPDDLEFYTGDQFPERYRGGAFVAFHGSWNRAPLPQAGYLVAFLPAEGSGFATQWEVFADSFQDQDARPVGVAMGPDGSLYIVESTEGMVWRVVHGGA